MRNLSKTFLRVNAILSYVFMGLFILGAVIFFIVGSPLVSQHFEGEGAEAGKIAYTVSMMCSGVLFVFLAVMALLSAKFSNKAKNEQSKGTLIMAIVFSALSGTAFGIAGGIIGLVQNFIEQRKDRINNIVDNQ